MPALAGDTAAGASRIASMLGQLLASPAAEEAAAAREGLNTLLGKSVEGTSQALMSIISGVDETLSADPALRATVLAYLTSHPVRGRVLKLYGKDDATQEAFVEQAKGVLARVSGKEFESVFRLVAALPRFKGADAKLDDLVALLEEHAGIAGGFDVRVQQQQQQQ